VEDWSKPHPELQQYERRTRPQRIAKLRNDLADLRFAADAYRGHRAAWAQELAMLLAEDGDLDEAFALIEAAIMVRESIPPAPPFFRPHFELLKALQQYATLLREHGEYARAEPFLLQRWEMLDADYSLLKELETQAAWQMQKRKFLGLEELHRRIRYIREAAQCFWEGEGWHQPRAIMEMMVDLAVCFRAQGKLDAAEIIYRDALRYERRTGGVPEVTVLAWHFNLSQLCRQKGDLEEAVVVARGLVDRAGRTLEPKHPWQEVCKINLERLQGHRAE
jgi:tetratricopeptide (TPR) repeat protein